MYYMCKCLYVRVLSSLIEPYKCDERNELCAIIDPIIKTLTIRY